MGVFTDQVQGLVSEEKLKRQERERKQAQKQRYEKIKIELHYILSSYFTEQPIENYQKIYFSLLKDNNKWQIINSITKKENEEYFLDINYLNTLNKAKNSYMIQYNNYEKQQKELIKQKILYEKQQKELRNQMILDYMANIPFEEPKKTPPTNTILFILFLPFWCLYWLFKGLLKNK